MSPPLSLPPDNRGANIKSMLRLDTILKCIVSMSEIKQTGEKAGVVSNEEDNRSVSHQEQPYYCLQEPPNYRLQWHYVSIEHWGCSQVQKKYKIAPLHVEEDDGQINSTSDSARKEMPSRSATEARKQSYEFIDLQISSNIYVFSSSCAKPRDWENAFIIKWKELKIRTKLLIMQAIKNKAWP